MKRFRWFKRFLSNDRARKSPSVNSLPNSVLSVTHSPPPFQLNQNGAKDGTRTRDRRFRKPMLYPAELPSLAAAQNGRARPLLQVERWGARGAC
jgi:hypothetical protein